MRRAVNRALEIGLKKVAERARETATQTNLSVLCSLGAVGVSDGSGWVNFNKISVELKNRFIADAPVQWHKMKVIACGNFVPEH